MLKNKNFRKLLFKKESAKKSMRTLIQSFDLFLKKT